jgi:hypothetical protein
MEKIWYIRFGSIQEGPYSVRDLKRDPRVKPDHLVWRKGFTQWVPIRNVRELKEVFEDEERPEEEENKDLPATRFQLDELALDMNQEPPHFYYWYIFILLALLAVVLQWAIRP